MNCSDMTPRERQCIQLAAFGLSNREIARKLFVTENTIKTTMKRAYKRLEVSDRAHAVAVCMSAGVVR